jgi:predicted ATPase
MEIIILGIILLAIAMVAVKILGRKKSPSRTTTFIVGEVGSGKTSLLYFVIVVFEGLFQLVGQPK